MSVQLDRLSCYMSHVPSPPYPRVHLEVVRMPKHSRIPRALVAVAALAALVLLVVAPGVRRQVGRRVQLGESSPVLSNPNQQAIAHGEDLAAKQEGWTVKHLDANLSPSKQVSDVDTFINLGVKGIITWTLDPGTVAAAYKRALAANIPIVDFGSTSNVTSTVYDERGYGCSMGLKAAKYISSADSAREGARGRRAAGAVDHELHQLLHQGREGAGPDRCRRCRRTSTTPPRPRSRSCSRC